MFKTAIALMRSPSVGFLN